MFLYDDQGQFIQDGATYYLDEMLDTLAVAREAEGTYVPFLKDMKLPEKYVSTHGEIEYINNGDETWTLCQGNTEVILEQLDYDMDYLYLSEFGSEMVIALSMRGTDAHLGETIDGEWGWRDLPDVKRIGGDEYYD